MNIAFYAVNLASSDCKESANIYSETFQGKIIVCKKQHAEIILDDKIRIFFDSLEGHCPAQPGNLTFSLNRAKKPDLPAFFQPEYSFIEKGYFSYRDKYLNRIWFYYRE